MVLLFKFGLMPSAESVCFNEHSSTKTARVPCLPPPPFPLLEEHRKFHLGFQIRRYKKKTLLENQLSVGATAVTYSFKLDALLLFAEVFMYYEMFSQSIPETVKYFMRCIHGWRLNFKCNLGRFYRNSRRAEEGILSL